MILVSRRLLVFSAMLMGGHVGFAASKPIAASPVPSLPAPKIPDANFRAPGGDRRFEDLFQPVRTQLAALSPDGRYLAYTVREKPKLSIVIVEIEKPSVVKTAVVALTDADATPMLANNREPTPAAIRWMRWATPTRLVAETNARVSVLAGENWNSCPGVIIAIDADGSNVKTLVTPRDVRMANPPFVAPVALRKPIIPTADEPTPPAAGAEVAGAEAPVDPSAPPTATNETIDPLVSTTMLERSPRAVDFTAGDPESLIVRAEDVVAAEGMRSAECYTVNINTGKIKSVGDELNEPGRSLLLDRQGKRRVTVPASLAFSFPHRFMYEPGGRTQPKSLDEITGYTAGPGFSVTPENYFGERAVPVAFAEDPQFLYFASNIGRDTYGIYALNLTTGKRTEMSLESPVLDLFEPIPGKFADPDLLVFDRYDRQLAGIRITERLGTTQWIRPEWRAVQAQIEKTLPGFSVKIQEWDQAGRRFLVHAHGPTDPGAFYIFDRGSGKLLEFVRRSPAFDNTKVNAPLSFTLNHPAGGAISGVLTVPRTVRLKPAPVVVLCQPEPWLRVPSTYQPSVLALADMGFFVVQINPRSAWGSGRRQRELAKDGFEITQVDDIVTTLDWLEKRFEINRRRIAIMGDRRGGYLALRALQLRPDRFRCAITIDPTIDLGTWIAETKWGSGDSTPVLTRGYYGSKDHLKKSPLLDPETIKGGVLLMSYREAGQPASYSYTQAVNLERALRSRGAPVRFTDLNEDYIADLPRARAEVYQQIEEFLNENLYSYRVDIGETEIKKN
jgi:pimeloyl-ACP methyl ester carboxylesterase